MSGETTSTALAVRRAEERFHTELGWLDSWHSFSFGHHYDPAETGHGLLIVSNDDTVAAGGGFGTHGHRDMEIVTWVLDGELEHRDSAGNHGVLRPGIVQRMSAGTGIRHSEMNHSRTDPVHFVQMWVVPDTEGVEPGYEQRDVDELLAGGDLVPVASGRQHPGAISIQQAGAALWIGRPPAGRSLELPDAPFVHLFVARGAIEVDGRHLGAGDSLRATGAGPIPVTATEASELLVWESDASVVR